MGEKAKVDNSSQSLASGEVMRVSACISKVKSLNGTASIVFARSIKKPGYSFEADLSFRISMQEEKQEGPPEGEADAKPTSKRFEGTLSLPELADFVQPKELSVEAKWKGSAPPEHLRSVALECLDKLRASVREQVA